MRSLFALSDVPTKISSFLPVNKGRSAMVHSLAASLGLFSQMKMIKPIRASYKDLQVYHSRDYLDFVLNPQGEITSNAQFGLEDDCPPFRGLSDYVQLVAGASLTAARALQMPDVTVAICWDGGRLGSSFSRMEP